MERTIGYLETSFLPLRRFEDIEDLQSQHDQWAAEVAFRRHHRPIGAKVTDAGIVERGFLAPLLDHSLTQIGEPKRGIRGVDGISMEVRRGPAAAQRVTASDSVSYAPR